MFHEIFWLFDAKIETRNGNTKERKTVRRFFCQNTHSRRKKVLNSRRNKSATDTRGQKLHMMISNLCARQLKLGTYGLFTSLKKKSKGVAQIKRLATLIFKIAGWQTIMQRKTKSPQKWKTNFFQTRANQEEKKRFSFPIG